MSRKNNGKSGFTYTGGSDRVISPRYSMSKYDWKQIVTLCRDFGLTELIDDLTINRYMTYNEAHRILMDMLDFKFDNM